MSETFILIPGRTSDQGCGISEGKFLEKYQREINTLQVAPGDMELMAEKVTRLLESQQLRSQVGSQEQAALGTRFTIPEMAKSHRQLYDSLLTRGRL